MSKIHLSTARKMLASPEPVDLVYVTAKGEVITAPNVVSLKYDHYAGCRNIKHLNSGEIRKIRDCLILQINGCEVFM